MKRLTIDPVVGSISGIPKTKSDVVIVLKSHGGSDESESGFINEARAYIRWHNSINESPFAISHVLKCYGIFRSYSFLPSHPYRYNILLEYADRGTLQDWYASARQPRSPVHIRSFWKSLAQILIALQALHQGLASGATSVHQDLKPSNIFFCSDKAEQGDEDDRYFRFVAKLGDFDKSHVTARGNPTLDSGGAVTYQMILRNEVRHKYYPSMEIWAISCIFIEVAVWIVGGHPEVRSFAERRRGQTSLRQVEAGAADSFTMAPSAYCLM